MSVVLIPYVNGVMPPAMKIISSTGSVIDKFELPECTKDGFLEKHIPKMILKDIIDGTTKWRLIGWKIDFTMHYNDWITGDTLYKFAEVFDYKVEHPDCKIILTPRQDNPGRTFEVYYKGDAIDLGILKGGTASIGHKLPVIKWGSVKRYKKFQISNPNDRIINLTKLKIAA